MMQNKKVNKMEELEYQKRENLLNIQQKLKWKIINYKTFKISIKVRN